LSACLHLPGRTGGCRIEMNSLTKLVIFGLSQATGVQDVLRLLGSCGGQSRHGFDNVQVDLLAMPGKGDEACAIVHLMTNRVRANQLADHINARQGDAGGLWSWVPVMAWA
jgi:hypothetical protein